MKAIILAAGLGIRMRPITERIPKPLVEVAGVPLIDWALNFAKDGGVEIAIVNTSYLAHLIEEHLSRRISPQVVISPEPESLETGGGIANALMLLGDNPFFAMNSDAICVKKSIHPFARMRDHFDASRMDALMLLQPIERTTGYDGVGDFFLNSDGTIARRGDAPSAPYVFTGVQMLHPRLFENAPAGKFSMNRLYDAHAERVHALVHDGDWLHVGDVSGLARAEAYLATH